MPPIPIEQRVTSIIFSLILLFIIVQLIRRHKLREEYALIWLAAGVIILVLSVFHKLVGLMASLFNVTYAPTLILVLGLLFALVIILSQSVVLSSQANRIRDLAQEVSLLKWRMNQLEEDGSPTDPLPAPEGNGNGKPESEQIGAAPANGAQS